MPALPTKQQLLRRLYDELDHQLHALHEANPKEAELRANAVRALTQAIALAEGKPKPMTIDEATRRAAYRLTGETDQGLDKP